MAINPPDDNLSLRAAWLAYVGGYTQEEIADRLGVSRVKAHRLISAAMASGRVKVFVEGEPAECIALEDKLMSGYGLKTCVVVPDLDAAGGSEKQLFAALGAAGANFLYRRLEQSTPITVGIGHGRTLCSPVDRLPSVSNGEHQFVSLIGSLTRKSAAHHFDVISKLIDRTGGECYYLPVPFIVDSEEDAEVMRNQRSVQKVLGMARGCELAVVGIGSLDDEAHLQHTGMLMPEELRRLQKSGAVGEVLGHFLDKNGQLVDVDLNRRTLGIRLSELRQCQVIAIAGGDQKVAAIQAALKSGSLTGLIVDESTARKLIDRPTK